MSEIALRFLLANLAAAVAILLVIALRKPARAAFGARLAYGLWLLVPLAALGSLLPPRVLEIARPAPTMTASYPPPSFAPDFSPAPPVMAPSDTPALPPAMPPASAALGQWTLDPWALGIIVWLAGALAMAAWQLRGQMRFLADARAGFAGPAVAGVFKPRIVTPADFEERFEKNERDVILAHETIHLANNDARINALVALVRCLCWFNLLIHVAAHLMRIDQELACDATVVERHPRARAIYAGALLKAQLASRPLPLGCYWPAGTEHPLTERVEMLKQARPTRLRRHIGTAALATLTLGAGASAWAVLPAEERFIFVEAPHDALPRTAPMQLPPGRAADESPSVAPPSNDVAVGEPGMAQSSPQPAPTQPDFDQPQNVSPAPELKGLPWILQDRADPNAPRDLRGVVVRVEWVNPAARIHVREEETGKAWVIETSTPNTLLRLGVTRVTLQNGTPITARGFAPVDKTCAEACLMYVHPTWMTVSGKLISPPPSQPGSQPIRYEPQQAPSGGAPGGVDEAIFIRGKVDKIDFGSTTYVIQLRASSTGRDTSSSSQPPFWGETANTALWRLSPTNYFGARDSIEKDLMGREVIVRGRTSSGLFCASGCSIAVGELIVPKSTAVPAPSSKPFGISDFAMYYDTTQPMVMSGKVQRIEFGNQTFDVWMQAKGYGPDPGLLYQVRSEYFLPRTDIEARLHNQEIVVSGWPARGDSHGLCSPVCGIYAEMMWLENGTSLTPGSDRPISPPPQATPQPTRYEPQQEPGADAALALRIVALKSAELEVRSSSGDKFVARRFEPGQTYLPHVGAGWTVSTPDGAAFEWRVRDISLGPLAEAGPVKAQIIDDAAPSRELNDALARRDEFQTKYSEKHPELQKANALVSELVQRRKRPPAQ